MTNAHGRFTVRVLPLGRVFPAARDQLLLTAAVAAGLVFPSSCRNGSCRACLCQATSGTVRYEIPWPGLSAEEKREGCVLPCVAFPCSDLTLEVPHARCV